MPGSGLPSAASQSPPLDAWARTYTSATAALGEGPLLFGGAVLIRLVVRIVATV